MAPRIRSYSLENRSNRLRLPVRTKLYSVQIAVRPAVRLGYRRNLNAGTWSAMAKNAHGKEWVKAFAVADDFEEADGTAILSYWQAVERARKEARGSGEGDADRPLTVGQALDRYAVDLEARGGDSRNANRVRANLPDALARKPVGHLIARELRQWRDSLLTHLRPSSVNRTCTALKACLNLAAALDTRITNSGEWERGLAGIPDAEESRNVVLSDDVVRSVVACAYQVAPKFGLLVEVCAVTGARLSQVGRLTIGDLQSDRLMMPPSRKGGKKKRTELRPIPIPASLVTKLRVAAGDRGTDAPLLLRHDRSERWGLTTAHARPFRRVVKATGLDPKVVTIYALRHSSVVRQLLAGIPVRVVASNHDTSVMMIEKTYSRYITDHTDALTRRALLDLNPVQPACNVVVIGGVR